MEPEGMDEGAGFGPPTYSVMGRGKAAIIQRMEYRRNLGIEVGTSGTSSHEQRASEQDEPPISVSDKFVPPDPWDMDDDDYSVVSDSGSDLTDSDDDDDLPEDALYQDMPKWKDVVPIPEPQQTEGQMVSIEYSPKFVDTHNYLRGVIRTGEKTLRALQLTKRALALNSANYSVWSYRRDCLKALDIPHVIRDTRPYLTGEFRKEMKYSKISIRQNQKNYQVWHHRKALITWASGMEEDDLKPSASLSKKAKNYLVTKELHFTKRMLVLDRKNYHCWQHRQWVIKTFGAFGLELDFAQSLINADVYNNSAWNQRYFVVHNSVVREDVVQREVNFTYDQILIAPRNESSWSYLKSLLSLMPQIRRRLTNEIMDLWLEDAEDNDVGDYPTPPFDLNVPFMAFRLDVFQHRMKDDPKYALKALDVLRWLLSNDLVRQGYWSHIYDDIAKDHDIYE